MDKSEATTPKAEIESIIRRATRTKFYANEVFDGIRVAGYYDDLDPEPERGRMREEIQEVRRKLSEEGFEVSDISHEYGTFHLDVTIDNAE